jgi:hypothetical protein
MWNTIAGRLCQSPFFTKASFSQRRRTIFENPL